MSAPDSQPQDPRAEADDQMIETLLEMALQPDAASRERCIQRVLAALDEPQPSASSPVATAVEPRRDESGYRPTRRQFHWRWYSVALAVAVLMAFTVWYQSRDPQQWAYAVVQQSLVACRKAGCREYRVHSVARLPLLGLREVEMRLFVEGEHRFALRYPPVFPLGTVWIGSNGEENWVVPERGPVLVGNEQMLERWLSERPAMASPPLHLTAVLQRMAEHYDLERLAEESLPSMDDPQAKASRCHHVRGTLRDDMPALPGVVELWADARSGVVRRLVLDWQRQAGEPGPQLATLELVGHPEVAADWFEHGGHHAPERKVLGGKTVDNER